MRLLCILLLLVSTVSAQNPVEKLSIYSFKGLDTRSDVFHTPPDYASVALNIHWSRNGPGTLSPRYEADPLDTLSAGYDSLLSMFPLQYSWGVRRLVFVIDSATAGWANVYVGAAGVTTFNGWTRIWEGFTPQERPSITQFNDKLLITSGQQKGILWDGKNARSFPMQTPGEPLLTPIYGPQRPHLDSSSYYLNGEYAYMFTGTVYGNSTSRALKPGPLLQRVRVREGRVRISNFTYAQADSTITSVDSVVLKINRTYRNPGILDKADSLWTVGTKKLTSTNVDTAVFIDRSPESACTTFACLAVEDSIFGRDTSGTHTRRYGAPTFVGVTVDTTGLFNGIPSQTDTLGFYYHVTWYDTSLGLESDTSRELMVFSKKFANQLRTVRIGIPEPPSGCVSRLYRSNRLQVITDSAEYVPWMTDEIYERGYYQKSITSITYINRADWRRGADGKWYYIRHVPLGDSVMQDIPLFLAQIPAESTYFTDSTRYDSLRERSSTFPFTSTIPPQLSMAVFADRRLIGTDGHKIWVSDPDSAFRFQVFNSLDIDDGDGDLATAIWPTRRTLVAKKNNLSYNAFNSYTETELTSGYGCVAPFSHAKAPGFGDFYLSQNDVIFEAEGPQLERTFTPMEVSSRLVNFQKLSITAKSGATGIYLPDDQQYLLSIGDSTYVYDQRSKAWSIWTGISFAGGCLIDTGTTVGHTPSKTFVYFAPGGNILYRYGKKTSTGTMVYETPLLFAGDAPAMRDIDGFGILGNGSSTFGILPSVKNANDSSMGGTITAITDLTPRYQWWELPPQKSSFALKLRLSIAGADSTFVINGLDIFHRKTDELGAK